MKWNELEDQPCSILRSAFLRTRRFDDFQAQLGITRHLLAARLAKLVKLGVLSKVLYQERPKRYEYRLTEQGRDLYPLLMALISWGDKWLDEGCGPPLVYRHAPCGHLFQPLTVCSECGEPLNPREVMPMPGPGIQQKLAALNEGR